jgi:outer membrane protein assembly factor BamD (BamD/ComL family)
MTTYATDGTYRTNLPIYNAKCWIIDRNTKNILGYKEFDSKHSIIQTTANIVTDVTELMPGSGAQWSSVEDISYRTAHDALYWAGKSVAASLSVQRTRRDILDLEAAYHKNPRDVRVLLQLASAYYRAGQGDRTPSLCDNFLKSNDSTVRDMLAVAYFYLTKEEFSRGFAVLDLIHQRFPQDSQACYEFAALCGSVPNSPKGFALDALDMAINIDPQLRNKVRNDARFMFLRDRARYKLMIGLD